MGNIGGFGAEGQRYFAGKKKPKVEYKCSNCKDTKRVPHGMCNGEGCYRCGSGIIVCPVCIED